MTTRTQKLAGLPIIVNMELINNIVGADMTESIKLENLRDLVNMGVVSTATILGQKGGYTVLTKVGAQDRILATKLGGVKMFATTDSAVRELTRLGLSSFLVDTSQHEKALLRAPRKDVTARAKAAAEALAYDHWVREQVEEALESEKNGTATWRTHDDVWNTVMIETRRLIAERDTAPKPKTKAPLATAQRPAHKKVQRATHDLQRARLAAAKKKG
jgi:hypothetical protein